MPTLQFKGKNIIWNHHLAIPYHTLDDVTELDFAAPKVKDTGNLIIEGDNLLALKSLLPQYAGKVDCIYIDPPYNTGNEGWVYNDKVNSPLINEWVGKVVGLDDLTRHDKWLCMIVPRLKILQELLKDEGAIFISIDENELYNLKNILDEIFLAENFIASITVQVNKGGRDYLPIAITNEFLLCYFKSDKGELNELQKEGDALKEKDDLGKYELRELRNRNPRFNSANRPNLFYPFYVDPNSANDKKECKVSLTKSKEFSVEVYPLNSKDEESCWRWGKQKVIDNNKAEISKSNVVARQKNGNGWNIYEKSRKETYKPKSIWDESEVRTEQGTIDLRELGMAGKFDHPKPVALVKKVIEIASEKDAIILDSFAGSGTTGQAVLQLNKEDGGNRKFILVQMPENTEEEPKKNICKDVTRERVKKAIEKYEFKSGFKYQRVGIPLDAESMLEGNLPTYLQFAKYVYYLCTGENLTDTKAVDAKKYFVGKHGSTLIYLVYEKDYDKLTRLALNLSLAEQIRKDNTKKKVIVYAPACFLDEEYLEEHQIQFVSIPYNLFQRNN